MGFLFPKRNAEDFGIKEKCCHQTSMYQKVVPLLDLDVDGGENLHLAEDVTAPSQ